MGGEMNKKGKFGAIKGYLIFLMGWRVQKTNWLQNDRQTDRVTFRGVYSRAGIFFKLSLFIKELYIEFKFVFSDVVLSCDSVTRKIR